MFSLTRMMEAMTNFLHAGSLLMADAFNDFNWKLILSKTVVVKPYWH